MSRYADHGMNAGEPLPSSHPGAAGRHGHFWLFAVVFALAGAGGAALLFTSYHSLVPAVGGEPPLIKAEAGATKMRPEQPGGMAIPHQDKMVFQRLDPGTATPAVERLLPLPESPLPRPVAAPAVPEPPPVPTPPVVQAPPPPPAPQMPTHEYAYMPAVNLVPDQGIPPLPQAQTQTQIQTQTQVPPRPAAEPPARTAAVSPPPAPPAPAAGAGGSFRVQLASVRSEDAAQSEWNRLKARFPAHLGDLKLQITRADLGDKGIFFRVMGSGVSEDRARSICGALKAQNVGCYVIRPGG